MQYIALPTRTVGPTILLAIIEKTIAYVDRQPQCSLGRKNPRYLYRSTPMPSPTATKSTYTAPLNITIQRRIY